MKRNTRNQTGFQMRPLKIDLTEAEILADLQYGVGAKPREQREVRRQRREEGLPELTRGERIRERFSGFGETLSRPALLITLFVVLLLVGGGVAYAVLNSGGSSSEGGKSAKAEGKNGGGGGEKQVAAMAKAGRKFAIMLQHRFRDASRKLRAAVKSGELGDVVSASASIRWWRTPEYFAQPGRGMKSRDGGGVLITQAIHTLDLFQSLTGPGARVTAFGIPASAGIGTWMPTVLVCEPRG